MANITVDWKVFNYKFASDPRKAFENLSYILFCYEFQQELLSPELSVVRDLFFNPNAGLQKFAEKINNRSTTLINGISSEITFNGRRIKITHPQSPIFEFASSEKNVFIVYGNAGTGKSGYIKDFVDYISEPFNK